MTMILAIETSHYQGSIAIGREGQIHERLFQPGLVHGRELHPTLAALCSELQVEPAEIDRVAVSVGPGSYTGIRIGVAAGKSLAWALGKPVLPISSLQAIADHALHASLLTQKFNLGDRELVVLVDARRATAYCARFAVVNGQLQRLCEDRLQPIATLLTELPDTAVLVGSGARTLAGFQDFASLPESCDSPSAATTLRLAAEWEERIIARQCELPAEYTNPHLLEPVYLRPSEAEEKRLQNERNKN